MLSKEETLCVDYKLYYEPLINFNGRQMMPSFFMNIVNGTENT